MPTLLHLPVKNHTVLCIVQVKLPNTATAAATSAPISGFGARSGVGGMGGSSRFSSLGGMSSMNAMAAKKWIPLKLDAKGRQIVSP